MNHLDKVEEKAFLRELREGLSSDEASEVAQVDRAVAKYSYLNERLNKESKHHQHAYNHDSFALKIVDERHGYLTVRVWCREAKENLFVVKFKKRNRNTKRGDDCVVYRFRNADSLLRLSFSNEMFEKIRVHSDTGNGVG